MGLAYICLLAFSSLSSLHGTHSTINNAQNVSIKIVYWQIKPFLFWNNVTQEMDGIYPIMFKKLSDYCLDGTYGHFQYVVDTGSRQELQNLLESNVSNGEGLLSPLNPNDQVMWGPYDFHVGKLGSKHYVKRNLSQLNLVITDSLVAIHPRTRTRLTTKSLDSINRTVQLPIFIGILTVLVGAFFGIIECSFNDSLRGQLGPLNAIYWSFVTMTTVGYGDVVPSTYFGKLICILWMNLSVVLTTILTATFLDHVTGFSSLSIENQRVAVIRDSHEEFFIRRDYSSEPILYDDYKQAIEATRNGDVFATVLPYDIAAWFTDDIYAIYEENDHHLSIAMKLGGKIPFTMLSSPRDDTLFDCFRKYRYDIVDVTASVLHKEIQMKPTFYGDISFIFNSASTKVLLGVTISFMAFAFVISFFVERRKRSAQTNELEKQKNDIVEQFEILTKMMKDFQKSENVSGHKNKPMLAESIFTNQNAMVY